jgi:hypothetical protein
MAGVLAGVRAVSALHAQADHRIRAAVLIPASALGRKQPSDTGRAAPPFRPGASSRVRAHSKAMVKKVSVPSSLTLPEAISFCEVIRKLEPEAEHTFDFSRTTGLVEPFGMLLVSSEIRRLVRSDPECKVNCTSFNHMSYAGHMGFFKSFGLDFGKKPGEAPGSKRYIPLTIMRTQTIVDDAAVSAREVGEEVDDFCARLCETLCTTDVGPVFDTLRYSMRELIRNVIEHSEAKQFGFCSQYWPSKGRAEVAILDRGIGLQKSLSPNPYIEASDHKRAINYAMMPAVSGKAFKGSRRPRRSSPWNNSGFRLYMTSRICRNGGSFFLGSGDTGMLLTSGKDAKRYFDMQHQGTVIRMRINTRQVPALRESLARYRAEGEQIQKKYAEIVNIDPSSASLMLSEDFDLSVWERLLKKVKGG